MQNDRRLTGHFYQVEDTGLAKGENSTLHWLCNASEQKKGLGFHRTFTKTNSPGLGTSGIFPISTAGFLTQEPGYIPSGPQPFVKNRVTFIDLHGIPYVAMFGRATNASDELNLSASLKWSGGKSALFGWFMIFRSRQCRSPLVLLSLASCSSMQK